MRDIAYLRLDYFTVVRQFVFSPCEQCFGQVPGYAHWELVLSSLVCRQGRWGSGIAYLGCEYVDRGSKRYNCELRTILATVER